VTAARGLKGRDFDLSIYKVKFNQTNQGVGVTISDFVVPARLILTASCILTLVGCSANNYSQPIATFADATKAADSALADLNKTATAQYMEFLSQRARTDLHLAVMARDGECDLTSTRCRIVLKDPNDPSKDQLFPPDPLLENMVVLMGDIDTYAQNLAAIVADDSATKAEASVNAALGSIETLANTVAKADGKGTKTVPSFATPVGSAVNWLVGQYAEHVKLEGLKVATKEAKPVIERAAALFSSAALFGSDPQRAEFTKSFRTQLDAYQDDRSNEENLNAAVDAAKKYNDFLQARPGETFQKMAEAHSALADALQKPDASWPKVIAQIQSFAAQAKELAKIAHNLAALANNK
jgi:hypothetical protein